jgi:deoxyribonuclease V
MAKNSVAPDPALNHAWQVTTAEARAIQARLAGAVTQQGALDQVRIVAGVDVGFEDGGKTTRACVALLDYPSLEFRSYALARRTTVFPYVPGLLSFREVPAILDALAMLDDRPDVLICDGQGLAHPRRFGIACHLGVLTGIPSIGVAKTRLTGHYAAVPEARGEWTLLEDNGEVIGVVLRTRVGVKPVYVSVGHRCTLEAAIDLVKNCTPRYRLPEPIRWADGIASRRPGTMNRLQAAKKDQGQ